MDLIDRQAAIDAVENYRKEKMYITRSRTILSAICEDMKSVIQQLPIADVPEKYVGKWVKNEYNSGWHCSECKEDDFYAYVWNSDDGAYKLQDLYCPNCGARMKGETDD